jgi:hypothetical protein
MCKGGTSYPQYNYKFQESDRGSNSWTFLLKLFCTLCTLSASYTRDEHEKIKQTLFPQHVKK